MSDSYYDCLGVEPDASEAEIEAAYREVVKQIHPDKSDSSDTKDQFMRVQEARAVLMDPIKRAQYDQRRTANTEEQTQDTNREQKREHDDRQQSQDREPQQQRNHQQEDWQRQYSDEKRRSKSYQSRTRTSNQADNRNEPDHKRRRNRASARTGYSQHGSSAPILEWVLTLIENVHRTGRTFLRMVRCPNVRSVDRVLLHSLITSPTGVRLGTTIAFVFVLSIGVRLFGYSPNESPSLGLMLLLIALIGSYAGYELLVSHPNYGAQIQKRTRNRKRTRTRTRVQSQDQHSPSGSRRIWPIAVTNLLGVSLVAGAIVSDAPTGGVVFTGVLLLPFIVPLLIYSGVLLPKVRFQRTTKILTYVVSDVHRLLSTTAAIGVVIVVFTRWGIQTPNLLDSWAMTTSSPWIQNFTIGPIYAGLFVNFFVGITMYSCVLWSMYAMFRYLTAAPWTDRFDYGYRIRPGTWNLLVAGPFVVVTWMVLEGVPTINIPLGASTLTLTQQRSLVALFFLPTVLTVLYIVRRRLEWILHTQPRRE